MAHQQCARQLAIKILLFKKPVQTKTSPLGAGFGLHRLFEQQNFNR